MGVPASAGGVTLPAPTAGPGSAVKTVLGMGPAAFGGLALVSWEIRLHVEWVMKSVGSALGSVVMHAASIVTLLTIALALVPGLGTATFGVNG